MTGRRGGERAKQPSLLPAAREWQGLEGESTSSSQALPIMGEQKAISFIAPCDPCVSEGGRKNKGIKHLALFLIQGGYKSISNKSYSHSSLLRVSLFTVNSSEVAGFSGVLFLHANVSWSGHSSSLSFHHYTLNFCDTLSFWSLDRTCIYEEAIYRVQSSGTR